MYTGRVRVAPSILRVERAEARNRGNADTSRLEQSDQSMSGTMIFEQIRDGERRPDQTELRGMIRLEQSRVKASGEKTWQIGAEREYHGEREEPFQKRKEEFSENIRAESEKISVEQSRASSVVNHDAYRGEDPTG